MSIAKLDSVIARLPCRRKFQAKDFGCFVFSNFASYSEWLASQRAITLR